MRLDAEFLRSVSKIAECPRWERVEIALAGRSNVGKSSLLNSLAGRKNLARISKTPGRTRGLNYFTVGERLALVDLPGYGFAKMPRSEAERIAILVRQYVCQRRQLKALVLLIDARRGPQKEELGLAQLLRDPSSSWAGNYPRLIVVATKCDKLKRAERAPALRRFEVLDVAPAICSARTGEGIDPLRREILNLLSAHRTTASSAAAEDELS